MVDRYDCNRTPGRLSSYLNMERDDNGDYVEFDDYAALAKRVEELEGLLEKVVGVRNKNGAGDRVPQLAKPRHGEKNRDRVAHVPSWWFGKRDAALAPRDGDGQEGEA